MASAAFSNRGLEPGRFKVEGNLFPGFKPIGTPSQPSQPSRSHAQVDCARVDFQELQRLRNPDKAIEAKHLESDVLEEKEDEVEVHFSHRFSLFRNDAKNYLQSIGRDHNVDISMTVFKDGSFVCRAKGTEKRIARARWHMESMLMGCHVTHGIPNPALEEKLRTTVPEEEEEAAAPAPESGGSSGLGESTVKVEFDGEEELIQVDNATGPTWIKGDWSRSPPGGGLGSTGRWRGKEWAAMTATEREILLVTTARRQKLLKEHFPHLQEM
jgi:hypothetical protein